MDDLNLVLLLCVSVVSKQSGGVTNMQFVLSIVNGTFGVSKQISDIHTQ